MKLLKNILFSLFFVSGAIYAMQDGKDFEIRFIKPEIDFHVFQIKAMRDDEAIGRLRFIRNSAPGAWEMTWFEVKDGYQGKGIGSKLFKTFFEFLKEHHAQQVYWKAQPLADEYTLEQLDGIYTKLVGKIYSIVPGILYKEPAIEDPIDNDAICMTYVISRDKKNSTKGLSC